MEVLKEALRKVSQDCCKEDTSCYHCLRTYNNQKIHKHLKRGLAKEALQNIIQRIYSANSDFNFVGSPSIKFDTVEDTLDFIDDEQLDEEDNALFADLIKEISLQNADIPDGFWIELKSTKGKSIHSDFYWRDKKILLFTETQFSDCEFMCENQDVFKCYKLNENLDLIDFVKELKK